MSDKIGDGPVDSEIAREMHAVAKTIDHWLNEHTGGKKWGFLVMMFPFDDHAGRCNYMSNAKRDDVIVLLKEQLRRFEGGADVKSGRA